MRHPVSAAALALCLAASATAAEPAKLSQDEAERLVFQCWKEVSVEHNGKKKPGLAGHRFAPDGGPCWPLNGELTAGGDPGRRIIIDAGANPMRIDFIFTHSVDTKERVLPCIFKI